ncbi:replication factor C large subunit [Halorubellus sp. JP-L1]|uniref:replication factor C large subunit n=1 Tax=Halorubellus sp. JP-L1 TaxID=2715753 RepID=UPI00140B33D6|nr:replication factor C large subunit [Halorubellus sp. JP-L1]NHN41190.1 replication factor C large subunit [Halorubellus sp. JP-L1]
MTDWTEKYRPTTLSAVRGNDKARDAFEKWARSWDEHRQAVILHGSPGVGKTSAAHALANDMGWTVMELNASDSRTADVVEKVAGEAAKSGTLTEGGAGRRLVVLDEADNFHGNADYGGSREVTRVVKAANQPIVLIANEFYDMSNGLRNACQDVEFRDVSKRSIVPVLRDICRQEGIEYEDAALSAIAEETSGDLRSAVNDLQALAEQTEVLTADAVVTSERDRTEGIFDFLDDVIKNVDAETALKQSYDVDETPDELLNWVEDNVPKDYYGDELADAYEFLSNADRWLGRVRATQDYSYWRYAGDNVAAGVAAARRHDHGGWTRYGPPSYWSKLGRTKGKRKQRDAIARKIAERSGTSIGSARRHVLPYLSTMIHHCKPRELTVAVAATYDLDESDISYVTGSGESTNKVESIVADARERRERAAVEHSGGAFAGGRASDPDADDGDGVDAGDDGASAADDRGQATLADAGGDGDSASDGNQSGDGDDDGASDETEDGQDVEERAEEAEDDDGQSGLTDFL